MTTDASQAEVQVQAPPETPAAVAIREARALQQQATPSTESQATAPPESTEGTPSEPQETKNWWEDEESRSAYLTQQQAEYEKKARERLDNQKRSLLAETQAERARVRHLALVEDLDRLRESDPEAFAERVNSDPEAADALARRRAAVAPELMQQARASVVQHQATMLFKARPDIEQFIQEQPDEWNRVTTDMEAGGIFGYIDRTAREEGAKQAIEDFRKSKEFRQLITDAEQRGAQDALGLSPGAPPSFDGSSPPNRPATHYEDPAQQAVAEAARAMAASGRRSPISDINAIRAPRRTGTNGR